MQRVPNWEDAVNSFRVDFNCDIYVTGSNAYMRSSEYATYLSGRCVEIKMLPLSFREFLYFYGFEIKEARSAFGGMPGITDVGLDQEKARPDILLKIRNESQGIGDDVCDISCSDGENKLFCFK